MPTLPSPLTWAREPARSSGASTWSKGRLTVKSATASAMPVEMRPFHSVMTIAPSPDRRSGTLAGRPGGDAETPQADEALGVGVAEGVGGVVGGQVVVVERHRAAAADHGAGAGRGEAQAHLAGDVALRLGDERIEGGLERREPQAVVDQLGPARLEARLLVVQVALERQVLQVGVGDDQRQRGRALVDLPALDPDPAVLDHVEPAEAAAAGDAAQLGDERLGVERLAVERDRHAGLEADDDLDRRRSR